MEEDIKILENKIKRSRDLFNDIGSHTYLDEAVMHPIENLIQRNKELEEENEQLTTNQLDIKDKCISIAKKLEEDDKPFVAEYILAQVGACPVWECGEPYCNYISKNKVKEKIEELNDLNSKFSQRVIKSKEFYLTELVQNILQELLEE